MFINGPYSSVLEEDYERILRRIQKNGTRMIVHHETCPVCGKRLVNLYARRNIITEKNDWRCRSCWEAYDAAPAEKTRISGSIQSALGSRFADISEVDPNILIGKPVLRKIGGASVPIGSITEIDIEKGLWYADIEVRHEQI